MFGTMLPKHSGEWSETFSVVPVLIQFVEEGNWEMTKLLCEIGPEAKAAIPALKKALNSDSVYTKKAARGPEENRKGWHAQKRVTPTVKPRLGASPRRV